MLSLQTSHSLSRELFLTLNKILGTERRTWMREGRRNNAGFLVSFTVTKKISFETTIFKVKKHFYCTYMGFLIFFFSKQNKSHECFCHLGNPAGFTEVRNWGIYSFIPASAGRPLGAEGTSPVPLYRVWALEHQGVFYGSTIATNPFQLKVAA